MNPYKKYKKTIITLITVFSVSTFYAQVLIGTGKSDVSNTSVSLEFGTGNRGLILPYVTAVTNVTNAVDGTLVLDSTDKKVKYKANGAWIDLSNGAATTNSIPTGIQDSKTEKLDAKVSIGTAISTTPGILVLEDANKAMVLPSMESPHLNIINPAPGMIAYDTLKNLLVVFNGSQWSFWKP
ncbi:MAG: hypothetical protein ACK5MD_04275 [Flavobacteriales bacterium]